MKIQQDCYLSFASGKKKDSKKTDLAVLRMLGLPHQMCINFSTSAIVGYATGEE
jgi:hypothetical protein